MMNTLTTFFDWLVTASLRASVLTLAVWIVQFTLQKHLSPRWRYALWLPVLVVLLMPVLPESRWSLESVLHEKPQVVEVTPAPMTLPLVQDDVPMISAAPETVRTPIDWRQISQLTWASGAALLLLIGGFSFMRALRQIHRTRQSVSTETLAQLEQVSREVGLRQAPRLLVAPTINSPAVTGLLRPVLLLPVGFERDFSVEEARLILQHELTHLKRHDLPLNTLLCVLMALHWFNPLLWLAFFMARADREAACDAHVLENATPQRRSEYGHALLKIESAFSPFRLSLGFVGMLQRHALLRARIRSIASPTRTRPLGGLLATAGILGMTFLGITRAEKPSVKAPPHEETKLIAIKTTFVHFKQDTAWDFDGRFKQLDPRNPGASPGGQIALLSQDDVRTIKEKLKEQSGAEFTAYPRMVTQDGKEVMIRSIVNQPVLGGKDTQGKSLIAYVPIGFIGKFTPKTMADGKVALDIDVTDSRIVATETIQGSDYPVASSQAFRSLVELNPGITAVHYAWQGHGWKDNKPVSYRPAITFITTYVIDAKAGGLPADAPSDITTGKSSFLPGDSIRITQVQRGGGFMTVTADYELASADSAKIALFITSTKDNGRTKVAPEQRETIAKGRGTVVLHHPDVPEGMPHVSFYPTEGGSSFGGIYFGTPEEAAQSRKYRIDPMTGATKSAGGNTAITLNLPDAPVQTVISIYEKLKGKKVSIDTAAKGNRVKIVATKPLPPQDAVAFIEAALLLNGLALVADGPDNLTLHKSDTPQPSIIETKLNRIILPHVQFSGATIEEAVEYLRAQSREFDTLDKTGVLILLRPGGTETGRISLDLKEVPLIEALRYCTELAGLTYKVEPYAVTIAKGAPQTIVPARTSSIILPSKIILPSVELRDATLVEAIELIRAKSRENDPDKKGVSILLKGDGGTAKMSLSLKDVPVSEALHYCAELSRYKLSADKDGYVLTPAPLKGEAAPDPLKPSDNESPETDAQAKTTELRRAKPKLYDFSKAQLGDVIRYLATEAGMRFISLPEDHPSSNKLITFSLRGSPFEILESICKANDLFLLLEQDVWHVRVADDAVLVRKSYALPKTPASAATILSDIRTLLNIPATNTGTTTQGAKKAGPEVTFREAENSVHVVATRLQHMWVDGYFKGLGGSR